MRRDDTWAPRVDRSWWYAGLAQVMIAVCVAATWGTTMGVANP